MSKLKVGDRAVCIDCINTNNELSLNSFYEIKSVGSVYYIVTNNFNIDIGYRKNRFEPAYIYEFKNKLDKILEE